MKTLGYVLWGLIISIPVVVFALFVYLFASSIGETAGWTAARRRGGSFIGGNDEQDAL